LKYSGGRLVGIPGNQPAVFDTLIKQAPFPF
jgi:hypothetical protein